MTQKTETSSQNKVFAEIIIFAALSAVLYLLRFPVLPEGGSVTAGAMVPVIWLSLRRGPVAGTYAGIILGCVVLVIEPFIVHPVQLLLDYPIAFGMLGIAGFFRTRPLIGVAAGILGRFIAHFISGVVFFSTYVKWGLDPVTYSAVYNAIYLVPEFFISAFIIYLLSKRKLLNIYA